MGESVLGHSPQGVSCGVAETYAGMGLGFWGTPHKGHPSKAAEFEAGVKQDVLGRSVLRVP